MRLKKVAAVLLAGAIFGTVCFSGCGTINKDAAVATLNKEDINLGYANFLARYTQATYDQIFLSSYGEDYWSSSSSSSDGKTMEDNVKDSVMDSIELTYLLEDHMADYGVEVTEEEQAAIKKAAEQFLADNSKDAIKQMGAEQEYVERMLYLRTVEQKMEDAIKAEVDTNVSDEEAAQRTFSYMKIDLKGYTDDQGTYQEYTEEEKEAVKQTAQAAATLAKQDFDAASENNQYDIQTYSYGSDEKSEEEGGFNAAVIEAANQMKAGDVSDLIEGTDCYYLIRLDSENDAEAAEEKKASIISTRQEEHYTEVTDGYKDGAEFKVDDKVWAQVKFDDLFTAKSADTDSDDADSSAPEE